MTTVLNRTNRGPGLISFGPVDVSAQVQPNTDYIITPIVTNAVRDDATLAIPVKLVLDGVVVRDEVWHFGQTDRNGNPVVPSLDYGTGGVPPTLVAGSMDLPRQVSIGLDVSLGSIVRAV